MSERLKIYNHAEAPKAGKREPVAKKEVTVYEAKLPTAIRESKKPFTRAMGYFRAVM